MATQNVGAEDRIESAQEQAIPESTRVSVDLNDLDLDVVDEGPIAQGDLGAADRKGRRTQWRELKEARDKAEQRAQMLENQMAEMRGRMSATPNVQYVQAPARQEAAADPGESEIENLWDQQQMILKAVQSTASTQADVDKATDQWRKLERRRQELIVHQAMRRHGGGNQEDGAAAEDRIVNQLLRADFPEIFASPAMVTRAMGEMQDLMSRGKPKSPAVAREACERVLERYGLRRKASAPTDAERAKYTSVPSRAGQGSSASGTYTPSPNVLRTSRAYTSHLPDLSDEERVRKWAREVGRPNGLI